MGVGCGGGFSGQSPLVRTRSPQRLRRTVLHLYAAPDATVRPLKRQTNPARHGTRFAARLLGNIAGRFAYEWLKELLRHFLNV
jgi:hypothetical protein